MHPFSPHLGFLWIHKTFLLSAQVRNQLSRKHQSDEKKNVGFIISTGNTKEQAFPKLESQTGHLITALLNNCRLPTTSNSSKNLKHRGAHQEICFLWSTAFPPTILLPREQRGGRWRSCALFLSQTHQSEGWYSFLPQGRMSQATQNESLDLVVSRAALSDMVPREHL